MNPRVAVSVAVALVGLALAATCGVLLATVPDTPTVSCRITIPTR